MAKETGLKSLRELVSGIMDIYPKLKTDRKMFSDFVIAKFVGDFIHDPNIKGEHELKKEKAKQLYKQLMDIWEELYAEENSKTDSKA